MTAALTAIVVGMAAAPAWSDQSDDWTNDTPLKDDGSDLIGNIAGEIDILNNSRSGSGADPPSCTWEDEDGEPQEGRLRWRLTALSQESWLDVRDVEEGVAYRYECWSDEMECGDPLWDGDDGCYGEPADVETWCESFVCVFESINPPNLARYAVDGFVETLAPPAPQFSPPGGTTFVNFDTWMWVDNIPPGGEIGPLTMSVPGMTVTTTATLDSVTWDMGDGGDPVACPLTTTEADAEAECSYSYPRSSAGRPGNAYHGSASLTWLAEWEVAEFAVSGEVEAPRTSDFSLEVAEVQTVVTGGSS